MDTVKVYHVGKEKAEVICPSCSAILLVDIDMSQNSEIECICGNTIMVIFEEEIPSKTCFIDRNLHLEERSFKRHDH